MEEKATPSRRCFLTAATSTIGAIGAIGVAIPFIKSWNPSAKAKAGGAPVEADISKLEPGAQLTIEWRGKPVWIIHRTPEMLKTLKNEKIIDQLTDPNSDVDQQPQYTQNIYRSRKEKYLVLVGICTHLGCAPSYRPEAGSISADWKGGFFCPCHGSKFDLSGRVYKGVPAPTNLQVPPHTYLTDSKILIGADNLDTGDAT